MPVRQLASTFPVVGIIVAITAGASSVAVIELTQGALLAKGTDPGHVGTLFWPQFGGAVLAAVMFGVLFHTKWTKVIALSGLVCIAGAAGILTGVARGGEDLVWVGSGLLGFGVGASVAPALFIAGFSLPSNNVARIFALIELLRAVAAFSVAPVLAHVALTVGGDPATGTRTALWICLGIAAAGAFVAVYLFVLARAKPHHPDIDRWIGGDEPAFDSPALAAALRGLPTDPKHHSDYPGSQDAAGRERVPAGVGD
jgi:MFS family permease